MQSKSQRLFDRFRQVLSVKPVENGFLDESVFLQYLQVRQFKIKYFYG